MRHLQDVDDAMLQRSWICSWSSAFVEYWPLGYNAIDVILNRVGREIISFTKNKTEIYENEWEISILDESRFLFFCVTSRWQTRHFKTNTVFFEWLRCVAEAVTLALFHMQQRRFIAARAMEHVSGGLRTSRTQKKRHELAVYPV